MDNTGGQFGQEYPPTKQAAEAALKDFGAKWGKKYPYAIRSWEDNWDELTVFFDFPLEIRISSKTF